MFAAAMPDTQSPVGSLGSTGEKAMSRGSMANDWPPNVRATEPLKVQGTVNPPWPSDWEPSIWSWTVAASLGGAMISVVPVSTIAVRPCKPRSVPSTDMASRLASQNPRSLALSSVTRVCGSNLVSSSPLERSGEVFE